MRRNKKQKPNTVFFVLKTILSSKTVGPKTDFIPGSNQLKRLFNAGLEKQGHLIHGGVLHMKKYSCL